MQNENCIQWGVTWLWPLIRLKRWSTRKTNRVYVSGFATVALAADTTQDPLYGGIFTTAPSYVSGVGEYHPPEDRQDAFDWKLSQVWVSFNFFLIFCWPKFFMRCSRCSEITKTRTLFCRRCLWNFCWHSWLKPPVNRLHQKREQ